MRKLLLVIICALSTLSMSAQRASSSSTSTFFSTEKSDQGVTFGIRAGVNFANMSFSEDGLSVSPKSRTSFHVGLIADIPLMESLYVQTGLFFQNKGFKLEYDDETQTAKPMYLEIPVLASYRYNFSDDVQLQVNFGPYFAYGIGGKYKYDINYGQDEGSYEYDFFGDSDDDDAEGFKRFDCGLQIGGGLTFATHYYVGISYEFGLVNIIDDDDVDVKTKNFMLSVGYNF